MISHAQFGKLRLADFLPDEDLAELTEWEFEDAMWVGEGFGFSQWLRAEISPESLRCLSIDFAGFPPAAAKTVLHTIALPLSAGMTLVELRAVLGDPVRQYRFVDDRVSYQFTLNGPPSYDITCTVLNEGDLIYLVVMATP